jgi:hypothetical protein
MQTILTFLLAGLATYSETYQRSIPLAAASLATAPKYILFPEQRAKKVRQRHRTICTVPLTIDTIIVSSVRLFSVTVIIHFVNRFGISSITTILKWARDISLPV